MGPQGPRHGVARCPFEQRQGSGQLEVGIGRVVVLRSRREPRLVEHAAGVDALVDKVRGDAEIVLVSFRLGPVAAVHAAIFRRDTGMVDEEKLRDLRGDELRKMNQNGMFVFLQSWRATLIPFIAVPVVLLGTFAILYALGFSINTMTLFGLVLATGLLVDDAIVVVENVERLMHENPEMTPRQATIESMAARRSKHSDPRISPRMMRSGRIRRALMTRSRMVIAPWPSRLGGRV